MRILNNKYELLKKIGEGGMSSVYLAMDIHLNKQWAVKEIHKNTKEYQATVDEGKVLSEVNLIKELDHYGLPRIVDIIDKKNSIYIVMDYIEGETLRTILDMYGVIKQEEAVKYGIEILNILEYLHNQDPPIIYRDLKPSNIMLKPDGNIRIIDFGIARKYKKGLDDTVILGTKGFAPPEQQAGKSDIRSDIYSFGVTLYQMLTNKSVNEEPYTILPLTQVDKTLSTGLEKIIDKCTQSSPNNRYQSVGELKRDLINYKKLEEEYIIKNKKKILIFKRQLIAGAICMSIGIGGFIGITLKENNDYNSLINRQEVAFEKREENLNKAISIKPSDITAYEQLIKEYAKDGFVEDEATRFLMLYNENKEFISKKELADLNFKIGELFLNYFRGNSDNSSRNTLSFAKPFFVEATNSTDEDIKILAENYVFLAEYQEDFVYANAKLNISESTREDNLKLLEKIKSTCENIISYKGDGDIKHLKIVTFEYIIDILDNEKETFINNKIEAFKIEPIIDLIIKECENTDVTIKDTKEKKKEILRNAKNFLKDYKESVKYQEKIKNR